MKATIAQTDIELGRKDENLQKALSIIKASSSNLILFPELFTTGFEFENLEELAEEIPGNTTEAIQEACGDSIVGGTIVEKAGGKLYNTFVLIDKEGVLAAYRKLHLFMGREQEVFHPGKGAVVADTLIGKLGLATCYDIRFPELFRVLMEKGAELVLVAAEFPRPRESHWTALLTARAIENQFFVIAANRVGKDMRQSYFGASMGLDPWGEVGVRGKDGEEILTWEFDISKVKKVREDFPVLKDIRLR